MGVHSAEEVSQFGCTDLKVLSDTLADKPFFFGDEPTTVSIIKRVNTLLVTIGRFCVTHCAVIRSSVIVLDLLCK